MPSLSSSLSILRIASDNWSVPVTIFRIGQIAGPTCDPQRGQWPPHDFVSLIMQTSKSIGLLPLLNAYCDWVPVDMVAHIMHEILMPANRKRSEICFDSSIPGTDVYNLVQPRSIHSSLLNDILQKYLGDKVRTAPLAEWIEVLKIEKAERSDTTAHRLVRRLLPFLETLAANESAKCNGLLSFDPANGVRDRKTMKLLQPINECWINVWTKQWGV